MTDPALKEPILRVEGGRTDVTLITTKQLKIILVHNDVNVAHATELYT